LLFVSLTYFKNKANYLSQKNGRNFGTQPIAFGGLFKIKK
jgi:hypothetical protein